MRRLLVLGLILAASVAAKTAPKGAGNASQPARDDDVREAVFRYQFRNTGLSVAIHFIAVDGKNPSDAFLKRFRDDDPPVRPISESRVEKKPIRTVVDKKSGQSGIIFRVGTIKWISGEKADVEGSYECGDNCTGAAGVYHAVLQDGHWTVESFDAAANYST